MIRVTYWFIRLTILHLRLKENGIQRLVGKGGLTIESVNKLKGNSIQRLEHSPYLKIAFIFYKTFVNRL